jgi:hypothetical protein
VVGAARHVTGPLSLPSPPAYSRGIADAAARPGNRA